MSERIQKLNILIKKLVAEILARDLNLKLGIFLTVVKVDTSPDLRYTKVFVSIFPEKETSYVKTALKNELYRIQGALNKKLNMKPIPRIQFSIDTTEVKADIIEKLLLKI
jgi:ribosome-binding factor A